MCCCNVYSEVYAVAMEVCMSSSLLYSGRDVKI